MKRGKSRALHLASRDAALSLSIGRQKTKKHSGGIAAPIYDRVDWIGTPVEFADLFFRLRIASMKS